MNNLGITADQCYSFKITCISSPLPPKDQIIYNPILSIYCSQHLNVTCCLKDSAVEMWTPPFLKNEGWTNNIWWKMTLSQSEWQHYMQYKTTSYKKKMHWILAVMLNNIDNWFDFYATFIKAIKIIFIDVKKKIRILELHWYSKTHFKKYTISQ